MVATANGRGRTASPERQAEIAAAKVKRFHDTAPKRVDKVLDAIRQLTICANTANYSYTETEVNKMLGVIEKAFNSLHSAYARREATKSEGFTF